MKWFSVSEVDVGHELQRPGARNEPKEFAPNRRHSPPGISAEPKWCPVISHFLLLGVPASAGDLAGTHLVPLYRRQCLKLRLFLLGAPLLFLLLRRPSTCGCEAAATGVVLGRGGYDVRSPAALPARCVDRPRSAVFAAATCTPPSTAGAWGSSWRTCVR